MSEEKWDRRDRKLRKRRALSMVVSNRSMKTVILPMLGKRAAVAKPEHRQKENRWES